MSFVPRFPLRLVSKLLLVVSLAASGAGAELAAVRVGDAWEIDTGAVRCVIDDRNYVRSLRLPDGRELMAHIPERGPGYFDLVTLPLGSDARGGNYCRFGHHLPTTPRMLRCDEKMVHLALVTDESGREPDNRLHAPLQIEAHYVFTPDLPGFYFFAVLRHTETLPDLVVHQVRHMMRCNQELFTHWRLSEERAAELAPWDEFQQAERIADATFELPSGRIVTKYQMLRQLSAGPVYGLTGDEGTVGLWVVEPGKDYHTGGPTKQNLTIQNGAMLMDEPLNGHCMGPAAFLPVEGQWTRVLGPWLYFATTADTHEAQWEQAMARAEVEQRAWPYEWCAESLAEQLYPIERGAVEGRVMTAAGEPAERAWAILGRPGEKWQSDSEGSRYWARTAPDGRFRIDDVRPGRYDLIAWREGNPRETRGEGVRVEAGETATVPPVSLAQWGQARIWQVGSPDRKATEFRRGDDFRHWNILRFYPEDFPNGVNFVVGQSREREDWNIAQPGPTVLEDGSREQNPWTIQFTLNEPTDAILTLGIADSSYLPAAGIAISANGSGLPEVKLAPGDSAAWRCAAWGRYQVHEVPLAEGLMRAGANTISLNLPHRNSWVMYDFVALRAGEDSR